MTSRAERMEAAILGMLKELGENPQTEAERSFVKDIAKALADYAKGQPDVFQRIIAEMRA
jgi:GTP cyclohydrolase I